MSYYNFYLQRLVGGNVPLLRHRLAPGHIVSFRYKGENQSRKLPRLLLVLNRINLGGKGPMVHGITLEKVPYATLYKFLKKVIVYDTIELIKRKYEIKGPFGEIIERPKSGFAMPISSWLKGPLRNWADELLDPSLISECGYLDSKKVRELWHQHLDGITDNTSKIWTVLMWQAWVNEWIK